MGADNWAICPRCKLNAEIKVAEAQRDADALYGQVSAVEYHEAQAAAAKLSVNPEDLRTFREDYELGVGLDGMFLVSYGGSCETCGLEYEFRQQHQLDLSNPAAK